jgi:hypothetical protein
MSRSKMPWMALDWGGIGVPGSTRRSKALRFVEPAVLDPHPAHLDHPRGGDLEPRRLCVYDRQRQRSQRRAGGDLGQLCMWRHGSSPPDCSTATIHSTLEGGLAKRNPPSLAHRRNTLTLLRPTLQPIVLTEIKVSFDLPWLNREATTHLRTVLSYCNSCVFWQIALDVRQAARLIRPVQSGIHEGGPHVSFTAVVAPLHGCSGRCCWPAPHSPSLPGRSSRRPKAA